MRIAILDDDISQLNITRNALKDYINIRNLSSQIVTFSSVNELLFADPYDIYLLDIIMDDMNGIEVGKRLRALNNNGLIIYLTSSRDYAIDSYDADAFFYLLKPINSKKLYEVLDKATSALKNRDECVYIKTKDGTVRLVLDDIYYAKLQGRHVQYICRNNILDSMTSSLSFKEMVSSLLNNKRFCLCGASLALNLSHIRMVNHNTAELTNGQLIDIPRLAAKDLYLAWSDFWLDGENRL